MSLIVTEYSTEYGDISRDGSSRPLDLLGDQDGDAVVMAVGGTATNGSAQSGSNAIMLLYAQEACWVRIGPGAVAVASACEYFSAGEKGVRFVKIGSRISVIAP